MHALLLNMIWPALFVSAALRKCWFLVFATVVIEAAALKWLLTWPWKRAMLASVTGNIISGLVGIFVMPYLMLLWHMLWAWTPFADLDQSSMVPSLVLMCLGSVTIEFFVVKRVFGAQRRLFLCLLVGNALTYAITAILLGTDENFRRDIKENIYGYTPPKYGAFLNSDGDSILTFWNEKKGAAIIRLFDAKDKKQVGTVGVQMQGSDGAYSTAGLSSGSYIVEMSSLGDTVYACVIMK